MIASINDISAPSVSLEGKTLWLVQALPVSPWQVLKAKLKLHLILTLPPAAVLTGCALAVFKPDTAYMVLIPPYGRGFYRRYGDVRTLYEFKSAPASLDKRGGSDQTIPERYRSHIRGLGCCACLRRAVFCAQPFYQRVCLFNLRVRASFAGGRRALPVAKKIQVQKFLPPYKSAGKIFAKLGCFFCLCDAGARRYKKYYYFSSGQNSRNFSTNYQKPLDKRMCL